jgi:hypothetical protein
MINPTMADVFRGYMVAGNCYLRKISPMLSCFRVYGLTEQTTRKKSNFAFVLSPVVEML